MGTKYLEPCVCVMFRRSIISSKQTKYLPEFVVHSKFPEPKFKTKTKQKKLIFEHSGTGWLNRFFGYPNEKTIFSKKKTHSIRIALKLFHSKGLSRGPLQENLLRFFLANWQVLPIENQGKI